MKKEITGHWIKIHDEKFQELYSPEIITHVIKSRRMRWAGHVEHVREEKGIHGSILVEKSEGQRSPARPMNGWENNTKMYLQEICLVGTVRIPLALHMERWWNFLDMKINPQDPQNVRHV